MTNQPRPLDPATREAIVAQLRLGQKIPAVKSYRDATGADLRTSVDAVNAIARESGVAVVTRPFGGNLFGVLWTLLFIALAIILVLKLTHH